MEPDKFVIRCKNIKKLYDQNVYTFTEYSEEIEKLIDELSVSKIEINEEDFLLILVPLINESILNSENLDRIKLILKKNCISPINHINVSENKNDKINTESKKDSEENFVETIKKNDIVFEKKNVPNHTKKANINSTTIFVAILFILIFSFIFYLIFNADKVSNNLESSNKSNTSSSSNYETKKEPVISDQCLVVKDWVIALGNSDFSRAFYLMKGKRWGTLANFKTIQSYGGINKTNFINCELTNNGYLNSEVIAVYEAYDPYNNDGKYKQRFFLEKTNNTWYIVKIENIEIINYRVK